MPYYVDARGFGALFATDARANVDLCASDANIAWVEVITGGAVQWRVFHGPTVLDVIRQLGDLTGRPKPPPAWAYGLWLASQGGRDAVLADVAALEVADIPASALWVQDWTGIRPNPEGGFGVQYLWDAKQECSTPDDVCYPQLRDMIDGLHEDGYKFLAYTNPFIVDPDEVKPEELDDRFAARFEPMDEMGLLVKDEAGESYIDAEVPNFPQLDAHPDFSRPETAEFIRNALVRIVEQYGIDGWMADFGEYIPPDKFHADGSNAEERRNTFPVDWARVNSEALAEARPDGDWAMISRSGFTNVQAHAQIHWVGDQQTDWGENDGIPTVVPALLNLGLAGQPFVSLDIGGFSTVDTEPRSKELFMRWTELGAFAPVMRTHEGTEKDLNVQWNEDEDTIDHLRQFTYVHCALKDDFMTLAAEAEESGAPILRHLMLVFPQDRETWDISDQFMIGDSLLVAPVTEQGAISRSVYFPEGNWFNVWTGEAVTGGERMTVNAPIGSPAVYSRGEDRDDIRNWETLSFDDCR
jgi:alpha-glucosidase